MAHRKPLTEAGNAEVFVAMYGDLVRFDHARRRWLVWDVHRWKPDNDAGVHRMALECVKQRFRDAEDASLSFGERKSLARWAIASESRTRLEALLAIARTMKPIAHNGDGWDEAPGLLGVPNGVVDLRTGELRDGRPEDLITKQAGIEYDPGAVCPRFDRFLREVLDPVPDGAEPADEEELAADGEMADYLVEVAGYTLTADAKAAIVAVLMGSGGNGKSVLLRVLRAVAGDYAREIDSKVIRASKFESHSTEVADLELVRLATCEEVQDDRLNSTRLKRLSGGGGPVSARRMRQDTREFAQTWTLWLTTNDLPRTDDNSPAFWRRLKVIAFPHRFDESDEPMLEATLMAELPGVLRRLVEGAVSYYGRGHLPAPPRWVEEATRDYREAVDPLEAVFASGALVPDPDERLSNADALVAYRRWADYTGVPISQRLTDAAVLKALRDRGFRTSRWDKNSVRGFLGLASGVPAGMGIGQLMKEAARMAEDAGWQ